MPTVKELTGKAKSVAEAKREILAAVSYRIEQIKTLVAEISELSQAADVPVDLDSVIYTINEINDGGESWYSSSRC